MAAPIRTFVVRVYADGSSTVQDVRSELRIAVAHPAELGARIGDWLAAGPPEEIDLRSASGSDVLAGDDARLQP